MASSDTPLIQSADDRATDKQPFVNAVVAVAAAFMLIAGVWAFVWPMSFAAVVQFPYHQHFLHDLGAFQIGIGASLLCALRWRDAITVALAGFVVATAVHAVSHFIDRDLGGRPTDWIALTFLALIAAAALVARLRFLKD
jgi:hypothetical protein